MGKSQRLDTVLTAIVGVLVVAVVGLAGYFGYSVYLDRQNAESATPALRIVKVLRAQVAAKPNDAVLRVRLGEALASANKPQEAIEQLNAAIKIDPKHTGAYLDLGLVAESQNLPETASRYYKKVIELTNGVEFEQVNQRRETAFYHLGLIALNGKQYDDAIGDFKAALRIRNDASDSYYYLARAMYLNGETDGAIENLDYALQFDPNFAQAHYLLGDIYWVKKDKVNSSYEFYKASQLSPNAPEPQKAIARFGDPNQLIAKARSEETTNVEAALTDILIARNLDPKNAEAAILHGEILVKRGKFKSALDVYRQAAELDPKNAQVKSIVQSLQAKYGKPAPKAAPKPKTKAG